MKTVKTVSLALALAIGSAVTGCAADSPNDMGGDNGGGGGGSGGDDVPRALDAAGKYQMRSTFDIATNMPGKVGVVTNSIIDATDSPDDPTHWILDQIIAKMPSGTFKSLLQGAEPFVAGYLNTKLLSIAPDFVSTMVQLGHDFGIAAKNFGLNEQIEVSGTPGSYMSNVTALGVHFKIDTLETDVNFADHAMANIQVPNVGVALDLTGKFDISEHKLPLSYGKVLRLGMDTVIIPALDGNATNLQTLLADLVNCQAVGSAINDALTQQFGYGGGATLWQGACTAGLQYGAQQIYTKIDSVDASALEFGLVGTAKAVDTNGDHKVDALQTGKWTGTLSYSGTPAPLAAASFTAQRM